MATEIADGTVVQMHYTLTNDAGDVIDTSDGGDPLLYLHGAGNIVPGLESQLTGKAVGDAVTAVVAPEDGYGERHELPTQQVPRAAFPADAPLEIGMPLMAQMEDGQHVPLFIEELHDDHIVVGLNHPLAGQTLHFQVEIVAVRAATEDELAHGHPHGPDGTHAHHH